MAKVKSVSDFPQVVPGSGPVGLPLPGGTLGFGNGDLDRLVRNSVAPATSSVYDVSTVLVGSDTLLHCLHSIENFTIVTWKGSFLTQSPCYISTIGNRSDRTCHYRMHMNIEKNITSLRIQNITALDEGNYTCEIVNQTGTYPYTVALQVLAEPFVLIKIDENGHPECQAVGGKPAANILWTPESPYDVKTWNITEQNGTTTVISSYNTSNISEVTCIVSHPIFTMSIERHLERFALGSAGNDLIPILGVVIVIVLFMLLLGIVVFWKRSDLRTCFRVKKDGTVTPENPVFEEVEPYASFTQKVNTIYDFTRDPEENKGAQQTGLKTYR